MTLKEYANNILNESRTMSTAKGQNVHSQQHKYIKKINIGDIVYLYVDKSKHQSRPRYLVVSIDGEWCMVRKFVGNTLRQLL